MWYIEVESSINLRHLTHALDPTLKASGASGFPTIRLLINDVVYPWQILKPLKRNNSIIWFEKAFKQKPMESAEELSAINVFLCNFFTLLSAFSGQNALYYFSYSIVLREDIFLLSRI